VYSSMRVTGQFRHNYALAGYPFDRQHLAVQFEDSNADTAELRYAPDTSGTACAPQATLDDWTVERCGLAVDTHMYPTSFGDPAAPPTASYSVARGTLSIDAKRSQPWTEYLKSTSVIYPSVLLIIISFFLMTEATNTLGARMSTAGAALFSVALSMKALSSQLNADNHFTLMDAIGLVTLVCVVFAGGSAMWCQRQLDRDVPFVRVRAVSHRLGWSALAVFLALNSVLVWAAVRG
jgi:multidrug transporter EmrE-like cation transporter